MRAQSWRTALAVPAFLGGAVLSSLCFADAQAIRLGTLTGPGSEIASVLSEVARDASLQVDVAAFDDPTTLLRALDEERIDLAELPNAQFLEKERGERQHEFAVIAYTVTLPTAIYSRSVASLKSLTAGDAVTVPQAPLERARALILLQNSGLLRLREGVSSEATLADISDNPKQLRFVEKEAAELAASLETSAAAVIPFHDAAKANLHPVRDALTTEDGHSPYAQILVVKDPSRAADWADKLVSVYRSERIKTFILTQFNGAVRRPW